MRHLLALVRPITVKAYRFQLNERGTMGVKQRDADQYSFCRPNPMLALILCKKLNKYQIRDERLFRKRFGLPNHHPECLNGSFAVAIKSNKHSREPILYMGLIERRLCFDLPISFCPVAAYLAISSIAFSLYA